MVAVTVVELVNSMVGQYELVLLPVLVIEAPKSNTKALDPAADMVAVLVVLPAAMAIVPCCIELTPVENSIMTALAEIVPEAVPRVRVTVVELVRSNRKELFCPELVAETLVVPDPCGTRNALAVVTELIVAVLLACAADNVIVTC